MANEIGEGPSVKILKKISRQLDQLIKVTYSSGNTAPTTTTTTTV